MAEVKVIINKEEYEEALGIKELLENLNRDERVKLKGFLEGLRFSVKGRTKRTRRKR